MMRAIQRGGRWDGVMVKGQGFIPINSTPKCENQADGMAIFETLSVGMSQVDVSTSRKERDQRIGSPDPDASILALSV